MDTQNEQMINTQHLMNCCVNGNDEALGTLFEETRVLTQYHHFIHPRYIEVAVQNGHHSTVERLIQYPEVFGQRDCAAMALAVCHNELNILELLIDNNWSNRFDLVTLAAQYSEPATLQWLLNRGVQAHGGVNPLDGEVKMENIDLLLEYGYPGSCSLARKMIQQGQVELFQNIFSTLPLEQQTDLRFALEAHGDWNHVCE